MTSGVWEEDPSFLGLLRADTGRDEVESICDLIFFQLGKSAEMLVYAHEFDARVYVLLLQMLDQGKLGHVASRNLLLECQHQLGGNDAGALRPLRTTANCTQDVRAIDNTAGSILKGQSWRVHRSSA
jgi:hypothetical protein